MRTCNSVASTFRGHRVTQDVAAEIYVLILRVYNKVSRVGQCCSCAYTKNNLKLHRAPPTNV